jgi:hypothetical protein
MHLSSIGRDQMRRFEFIQIDELFGVHLATAHEGNF